MNNGTVANLEIKEIEVESSIKQEEGSEDMKEESEGLQMERIHEKCPRCNGAKRLSFI